MRWAVAVALATFLTYLIRLGSTRFAGTGMPPAAHRAFRHAAVALMAALVVSSSPSGVLGGLSPASASGLTVAIVAARFRSNATLVMALGVAVYGCVDIAT